MIKKSLYMLCTASILSASATMCYKKEHLDPSTIETVTLNGGECNGTLSVVDMKKNGYVIDSMKIQNGVKGFNYIYVFQKNTPNQQLTNQIVAPTNLATISDAQLTARIEKIQKAKEIKKVEEEKISHLENGKNIYTTSCTQCHGLKAEKYAHPAIKSLNSLSFDEFKKSIRDYVNDDKDNGMAIIMRPYADSLISNDIEDVYNYIQTIK